MSIWTRLARVEQLVGACAEHHVVFRLSSDPRVEEPLPTCPDCGRQAEILEVVDPYAETAGAAP